MDEITFEKSIKSIDPTELRYAEHFLEFKGAKDFVEYRYAKNFLNHPDNLKIMEMSLAEMIVHVYKTSRPEESFPSYLIKDSEKVKWAWNALNLIAQDRLREGKPLPPELAEWVIDVLADQLVTGDDQKRRPRRDKDARSQHPRDLLLCIQVDQLRCLFDLYATRNDSTPPVSACDVVAAADGDRAYGTVADIWNRRDPVLKLPFSWNKQAHLKKFLRLDEIQNPPVRS